jgi:hypothetical protein
VSNRTTALLACLAFLIGVPAGAQSPDELKVEIKARCESQMGEYGRSLVLSCVKQDIEAVSKIVAYQNTHSAIASRCLSQMREYGFSLVASCIDQDVKADRELGQL